jgi:predicted DCC family thiol-disulfide oxidoreductase YuxK
MSGQKFFCRPSSVNSEITKIYDTDWLVGWILYDAECALCRSWVGRCEKTLTLRGFDFAPLQSPWVRECFDLPEQEYFSKMRVLTRDGRDLTGADALVFIARHIWWVWPLYAISKLPGVLPLFRAIYDRIARSRSRDCSYAAHPKTPSPTDSGVV